MYDSHQVPKNKENQLEPFIKHNIAFVCNSPLQNNSLFPNGLYVAFDDHALHFIHPKTKHCNGIKIALADHMTFSHNKSDKTKSCHFYTTIYDSTSAIDFTHRQIKDFFPATLKLPEDSESIIKHPYHAPYKQFILQLLTHPITGTKTSAKKSKPTHRPISNQAFFNFWTTNKIKHLTAIGVKETNNTIRFTIHIHGKGRIYNNRIYDAFSFTCNISDDYEALLQAFIPSHCTI